MNAPIDFNTRVDQYVRLRDKVKDIKEKHKAELKPYNEAMEALETMLLNHLNTVGGDSVRAPSGTVYKTLKNSATIADKTAFWTYVVTQGLFDLIDYKANAPAIKDYIDANKVQPPGVNFTQTWEVGIRRGAK